MTSRTLLASALALLAACREQPAKMRATPDAGRRRTVATFSGTADPATGTLLLSTSGIAPSALTEVPVVQDGVPGSGPPDTVELVTESYRSVEARCGVTAAFEGSIRMRSFYTAHTLSNLHAEITSISLPGHESCRSAQPILGTSIANGLFAYPSLTAAGTARDSAAVTWSFRVPDQLPFTFQGRVVADVLAPCAGQQQLGSRVVAVGSSGGSDLEAADLNGDGVLDLVLLSTDRTTILRGLGDGDFAWVQELGGGDALAVADVTGDGRPDLLVAHNAGSVSVYRNTGRALASTPVVIPTGGYANLIAVGDLTGDGRPDLVVADRPGGVVRAFANTGTGGAVGFTLAGTQSVGGRPETVEIGDVNGDGRLDVVAAVVGTPHTIAVLLGAGDGTLLAPSSPLQVPFYPVGAHVGDLDGDGRPDLVVEFTNHLATHRNLGAGPYPAPVSFGGEWSRQDIPGGPYRMRLPDLDGDGRPDVVVSAIAADSLAVLMNDGTGLLAAPVLYAAGTSDHATAYGVAVGDWNGDGQLDAAVADHVDPFVYTYLGRGDGTLTAPQDVTVQVGPMVKVLAGDLDGDGREELVTVNSQGGSATVLDRVAGGTFTSRSFSLGGYDAHPVDGALADLDGDGAADLVAIGGAQTVSVLLGRGDGTFDPRLAFSASATLRAVAVADLDGDLRLDLVLATAPAAASGRLELWLGRGDGTFTAGPTVALPAAPNRVAVGDLDGDGVADLAVLDSSGIGVYRGTGGGTFAAPVTYAGQAVAILLADLDGDGRPDLVALRSYPGGAGVSLNQGDGTFGPETLYEAGYAGGWLAGPNAVVAADLDGDGHLDLAVTGGGRGTPGAWLVPIAVLRNLGNGAFAPSVNWQTGPLPRLVGAGDVDGDGRIDLAVAVRDGLSVLRGECF